MNGVMIDTSVNTVLQLLRTALGNEDTGTLSSDIDWREVVDLCFEQGVAAITVDGLQMKYESNPSMALELDKPELMDLKYEWYGAVFRAEADFQRHQSELVEFLKLCKLQDVKVLLLKGYGLSLNYTIPAHRPCGDIDVYLYGNAAFVSQMVEKHWNVPVDRGNQHHYVFSHNGVTFENHITLLDIERHRNHFSDEQVFQKMITEGCDEIEVGGERCFVPSVKLNSVYLLRHMAHHFSVEKITLRHILDWALFVKANASKVDWDYVYGYAKDSGCSPFLNCLNGICVESLGFAADSFPVRARDGKLQSRMLADILYPEFQEEIPDTSRILRYGIVKTRRIIANRWKYRMVSNERLVTTFLNLAKDRLRREKEVEA